MTEREVTLKAPYDMYWGAWATIQLAFSAKMLADQADESKVWKVLSYYQVFWWEVNWLAWALNTVFDRNAGTLNIYFLTLSALSTLTPVLNTIFGGVLYLKKPADDKHFNSYFSLFMLS